jgi:acetylornithine deacetylase/succinyl-diaminopimelate desuccinylase-like protein
MLDADAIIVADTGNFALGVPTFTTTLRGLVNLVVRVRALDSAMHSGMFGGPAPDALLALIRMLATLRDARGDTTIDGLADGASWSGIDYPAETFRADAHVLDGVDVIGSGRPQDMLWARPAVTVLGMDCPPVVGSAAAAYDALAAHLRRAAPWNVLVDIEAEGRGEPFTAGTDGPAYDAMSAALSEAFGRPPTTEGQGGSIPLCNVLQATYPEAEIMMIGVEEPRCLIHAPNESVDPGELERIALAEALFLRSYGSRAG